MTVKVAHLITRLDLGGAQQNTLYTVAHLDRSRFEPLLVCGPGGLLDAEAPAAARTLFVSDLVREVSPLRDAAALFHLASLLREERPAIVHTHSSKAGILGRFAAALAGVPVVLHTFHGFGFHDYMSPLARGACAALEREAARASDALVFVSEANMRYAASHGIGADAERRLIRSGIRLAGFPAPLADRKAKRAALGVRRDPPLVVGVGNLKAQKNADDFLRVAEEVCRRVPEVSFAFVGDGPRRSALEARAIARGLSRKVSFLGWRRDTAEILAAADAFLLTSLWEGLPRSLVEAMRTGLPCVAYGVDGVLDLLREDATGYPVPPGDWRAAADRVEALLRDPGLRARLGRAAAAAIGPEFDIDGMVRSQESLYEELLSRRGRHA